MKTGAGQIRNSLFFNKNFDLFRSYFANGIFFNFTKSKIYFQKVDDLLSIGRKWTRRLLGDSTALRHIRDVVQKLPLSRQLHLLAKFTSMNRLKTFRDIADFSRPSLKSLPSQLSKFVFETTRPLSDDGDQIPAEVQG